MPTLAQYRLECRRLLHDSTGRYWSNDELDDYINDARLRVTSDTGCLRRLVTAYLTTSREQYPFGSITGAKIVGGGSGYVAPSIVFSGGDPVVPAVATATLTAGVITALTFSEYGQGYESAPTVTIADGSPVAVASLTVDTSGVGYWSQPTLVFSGGGGTGASGEVTLSAFAIIGTFSLGSGYAQGDILTLSGGVFTRAATLLVLAVNFSGGVQIAEVVDGGEYTVLPGTPVTQLGIHATQNVSVDGGSGSGAKFYVVWALEKAYVSDPGSGYATAPAVAVTGGDPLPTAGTVSAQLGAGGTGASILVTVIPQPTLDVMNITPIWGNQRVPLNYMPWTEFNAKLRTFLPNPQLPRYWSRYGSSSGQSSVAFLGPVPDQGYTTEFDTAVLCAPLASDDEVDVLQYPYSAPVAYYACWKAKMKQQAYTEGEIFLTDYRRKVLEAQASIQMRRIPNPYGGYTGA